MSVSRNREVSAAGNVRYRECPFRRGSTVHAQEHLSREDRSLILHSFKTNVTISLTARQQVVKSPNFVLANKTNVTPRVYGGGGLEANSYYNPFQLTWNITETEKIVTTQILPNSKCLDKLVLHNERG